MAENVISRDYNHSNHGKQMEANASIRVRFYWIFSNVHGIWSGQPRKLKAVLLIKNFDQKSGFKII